MLILMAVSMALCLFENILLDDKKTSILEKLKHNNKPISFIILILKDSIYFFDFLKKLWKSFIKPQEHVAISSLSSWL